MERTAFILGLACATVRGTAVYGAALLMLTSLTYAQTRPAAITVHPDQVIGPVNSWVFGNNTIGYEGGRADLSDPVSRGYGVWDPDQHRSVPEMTALAKDAGVSVARYPGGCSVHLFDWKKTIGPLAQRPEQPFGLPEYLQNCADIGALPLLTISDYFGSPQDAADLVEYLNAPEDGQHPWAARRAADGHPAPWGVVWFEYGNETEHGDHHGQRMTAAEYARNYLAYQRAMKAIDPRARLGAVIATGFPTFDDWARPVLSVIGGRVDFVIHHSYLPAYTNENGTPDAVTLFALGLAGADQIQDYYDRINALLAELAPGREVPIAVTEYNGHFVQEKPVPYRLCLGNALVNAEMLRVFLRPQNHIVMANFWQFANEYWGTVKGYPHLGQRLVKRPPYYVFELYHNHFGSQLIQADVACEAYETDGGFGIAAARGAGSEFKLLDELRPLTMPWTIKEVAGVTQRVEGDTLVVDFASKDDVNYYHARRVVPVKPGMGYRLTGWVKTEGLTSASGAGFQIGDARGYDETKSVAATADVRGTRDWTKVSADYVCLPDTKEIEVLARRVSGGGPVAGRAHFRGLVLQPFVRRRFPAVPYLTVNASRSQDGKTVYLMVVNKDSGQPRRATVMLEGFRPQQAKAWILTGPSVDATNEENPTAVSVQSVDLGEVTCTFSFTFPPHSLTALEITSD